MKLGNRLRELRNAKGYTLRKRATKVDVGFTYICKIETGKLDHGHTPSDPLLHILAEELSGDDTGLLILAERIPESIRRRVIELPDASTVLTQLGDKELNRLVLAAKSKLIKTST